MSTPHENLRFLENKKVLQSKNALTTIPEIAFFSAFWSKNTPTVPHQTIHLLCEKITNYRKSGVFPSQTAGATALLIQTTIAEKVKSHCLELIIICYFPDLFQLSCKKTKKYRTISIFSSQTEEGTAVFLRKKTNYGKS